jgi:hypothetical protein
MIAMKLTRKKKHTGLGLLLHCLLFISSLNFFFWQLAELSPKIHISLSS